VRSTAVVGCRGVLAIVAAVLMIVAAVLIAIVGA